MPGDRFLSSSFFSPSLYLTDAYLTDTPVFELLASGRAKEVSPLLSLSWILALSNAFISDVYTQSLPAKILLFFSLTKIWSFFYNNSVFLFVYFNSILNAAPTIDSNTSLIKPAVAHSGMYASVSCSPTIFFL